jgi:hypothetical protein
VPYGQYTLCFKDGTKYWTPATYPNAGATAGKAFYDNTTPPTGQPTTEALTGSGSWASSATGACVP